VVVVVVVEEEEEEEEEELPAEATPPKRRPPAEQSVPAWRSSWAPPTAAAETVRSESPSDYLRRKAASRAPL
jgi:hypothetical protein